MKVRQFAIKRILSYISLPWRQTKKIPNDHKLFQMKHEPGCFHSTSVLFATSRLYDAVAAAFKAGKNGLELAY